MEIFEAYYREEEVLNFLGWKQKTIQTKRSRGEAPPAKKIGKIYFYEKREFKRWFESQPSVRPIEK